MKRTLFLAAVLGSLAGLISGAHAQEKNELTGLIGRTFVSDQGVTGTSTPGALLTSGAGLSLEGNYGRRLMDFGIVGLTAEVPFVVNLNENVHYDLNLVPKDYKSFFVTPSLRANLFPGSGISPWVSAGGGFGYFKENSKLEFGGTNPGETGTTTGIFQIGGGLDIKLFSRFSLRGEVRDFFSGIPQLNVDTGKSRQHNFFVGAGVIFHF
jgi:opacity protein-like surface antigen